MQQKTIIMAMIIIISHTQDMTVSVFETVIRVVGGLLSAYDLSANKMFLEKAKSLGEHLCSCALVLLCSCALV